MSTETETTTEIETLIPIVSKRYAEYPDSISSGQIIHELPDDVKDFVYTLTEEVVTRGSREYPLHHLAVRYGLCQSNRIFKWAVHKSDLNKHPGEQRKKLFHVSCDSPFCSNPACVKRRRQKRLQDYAQILDCLYNPNPHAALQLRSMLITSPLTPTRENKTLFSNLFRKFLRTQKRILFGLGSFHIHQSRLHIHILVYGQFFSISSFREAWHTFTEKHQGKAWKGHNKITQLRKGFKAAASHLTQYIMSPKEVKETSKENLINLIKEFYNTKLLFVYNRYNLKRYGNVAIIPRSLISDWEVVSNSLCLISLTRSISPENNLKNHASSLQMYLESVDMT